MWSLSTMQLTSVVVLSTFVVKWASGFFWHDGCPTIPARWMTESASCRA
jgi:hypothetical protein